MLFIIFLFFTVLTNASVIKLGDILIPGDFHNDTNVQEMDLNLREDPPVTQINSFTEPITEKSQPGLSQSNIQQNLTTDEIETAPEKRSLHWASRTKDTAPGYNSGRDTDKAPVVNPMHMFLTVSLPIAICGIFLGAFCTVGLKPNGYLCNKIYASDCDVLVSKI